MSAVATTRAIESRAATSGVNPTLRRKLTVALLVAIGYYVTAKIGFAFALQPGSVSTLWMPNSILLAGLLLMPRRSWWMILVAALPAHLASEAQSGVPLTMILSWFLSNSFQALFGAFFICKFVEDGLRFDRFRDLTIFLFFGAFLAPFLASFLDVALVKLNGWGVSSFWQIWRVRCLSNILSTLTLVPVIITWVNGGFTAALNAPKRRYVEAVLLTAGLLAVGLTVFDSQFWDPDRSPSLLYWPLPFLLWATVRFGPSGVSSALLLVMFLAITGATHGQGPFVGNSATENALAIQWFLIVVSIPLMSLAAVIEERRRAEKAAHKNEEHLALAMNAAQMGTWEWNITDNTAIWSDETKRMFGRSPSDPEGTTEEFFASVHPEDRSLVAQGIDRAVTQGEPYETEFRVLQPDGSSRWVRGKGQVIRDEDGKRVRIIGLNADITEQKHAEQALRESEDRYRSVVESQTELICRFLPDTTLTYVNDAYCRYFGKSREELIGIRYTELLPPSIRPWAEQEIALLIEHRGTITTEHEVLMPDGSIGWQQWVDHAIPGPDGKILELQAIGRDVTERKRAEHALLESSERNQAILRVLPDIMFLQNTEGVYLDYYARDPQELLVPPETFLGKNTHEVLPAELADKIMGAFRQLEGTVETQVLEYSLEILGQLRHFEARIVSAEGDKVLTIVRNVTESRLAADALRRSEEKLLVSNRKTRELAARLITAQESERRRIALLLHDDLSQNIAAMGVAISRLKRKPPATNEMLTDELDRLSLQTHELTTQIRKLSHQLHPDVLEHVGLVAALKSEVSEIGHNEQIKLKFEANVQSERIPLDVSICLYRVAIEALRNVSKHSGASSASVVLGEDDNFITLEVADSGRGFDVEKARRGSGLGLISAEERVKLLQGTFLVSSKLQAGTVLHARVPLGT